MTGLLLAAPGGLRRAFVVVEAASPLAHAGAPGSDARSAMATPAQRLPRYGHHPHRAAACRYEIRLNAVPIHKDERGLPLDVEFPVNEWMIDDGWELTR